LVYQKLLLSKNSEIYGTLNKALNVKRLGLLNFVLPVWTSWRTGWTFSYYP